MSESSPVLLRVGKPIAPTMSPRRVLSWIDSNDSSHSFSSWYLRDWKKKLNELKKKIISNFSIEQTAHWRAAARRAPGATMCRRWASTNWCASPLVGRLSSPAINKGMIFTAEYFSNLARRYLRFYKLLVCEIAVLLHEILDWRWDVKFVRERVDAGGARVRDRLYALEPVFLKIEKINWKIQLIAKKIKILNSWRELLLISFFVRFLLLFGNARHFSSLFRCFFRRLLSSLLFAAIWILRLFC